LSSARLTLKILANKKNVNRILVFNIFLRDINEYLEKGGKITKLECIIPEQSKTVLQESQMKSFSTPVVDQDFYTKGAEKEAE